MSRSSLFEHYCTQHISLVDVNSEFPPESGDQFANEPYFFDLDNRNGPKLAWVGLQVNRGVRIDK